MAEVCFGIVVALALVLAVPVFLVRRFWRAGTRVIRRAARMRSSVSEC